MSDQVCSIPLSDEDVKRLGEVAEALRLDCPSVLSLAVRLLHACQQEGAMRITENRQERFIVARCRDRFDVPGVYRRMFF